MPGNDIWLRTPAAAATAACRRSVGDIDPDIKPMKQSSFSAGTRVPVGRNSVFTVHYIHNDLLETIEDIGFLDAEGDEGYIIGNPGRGLRRDRSSRRAPRRPVRRRRGRSASTTRSSSATTAGSRTTGSSARNYTLSRLYGNYAGLASSDEITHADDRWQLRHGAAAGAAASPARAATSTARGTSTSCCSTRTATSTCSAVWRRIVRTR